MMVERMCGAESVGVYEGTKTFHGVATGGGAKGFFGQEAAEAPSGPA